MQNIYVVKGSTGEQEENEIWFVAAYFSKKSAEQHVLAASQRMEELIGKCDGDTWESIHQKCLDAVGKNQFDPSLPFADRLGVFYSLERVTLYNNFEEFARKEIKNGKA